VSGRSRRSVPRYSGLAAAASAIAVMLMSLSILPDPASAQVKMADSEIARAMGPPYYSGAILPTPREVEYYDEAVDLANGHERFISGKPEIRYSGKARDIMMRLYNNRFENYTKQFPGTWREPDSGKRLPILFALISDPVGQELFRRHRYRKHARRLKPQGYLLKTDRNSIVCVGHDTAGLVNGMASLIQLMHIREGKLVVRKATILDWPVYRARLANDYFLPSEAVLDWMMLYKLNGMDCGYADLFDWRGLSSKLKKQLEVVKNYAEDPQIMRFIPEIHIGGRRAFPRMDCGSQEDIDKLLKTVEDILEYSGANDISLLMDDVPDELVMPQEMSKFERLGQAHGFALEQVYSHIQKVRPGSKLLFCPPYYQGRLHKHWKKPEAFEYMKDSQSWNKNIIMIWTGPHTGHPVMVPKDIKHYRKLVGPDRPLVYWDNTGWEGWSSHPLIYFHYQVPKDFASDCDGGLVFIKGYVCSPIHGVPGYRILYGTAVDHYWNPETFDHEYSRRQAVAQFIGPEAVPAGEEFYQWRLQLHDAADRTQFKQLVDLSRFEEILKSLEKVSWDDEIMEWCRRWFNDAVSVQNKGN